MNFLTYLTNLHTLARNGGVKYTVGTQLQSLDTNGVTGDPSKIATLYTCCSILSNNLSRMPISVFIDNGKTEIELKRHRLSYLLKYQPNDYQNAQQFWSTIEYHRNEYGNGIARIHRNKQNGYPTSLEIIHPGYFKSYEFINGILVYSIMNYETQQEQQILASDILHFRGLSENGIIGLSPLVAIERQTNINERATATLDNFHKNNAVSPNAIETEIPGTLTASGKSVLTSSKKDFIEQNVGPANAGKFIHLPVGSKIKSMAMQFADAQLIETLRFTREDISAAYGILLGMVDGSFEKLDVNQLTTLFKNNTMGPIVSIYMAELNSKLLTRGELENGISVMFDVFQLIAMDYTSLVSGIKDQVVNGLMTPNEGAKKLRNKPIPGVNGDKHYMQAQYIPLEDFDKFSKLIKEDPSLKTIKEPTIKKEK